MTCSSPVARWRRTAARCPGRGPPSGSETSTRVSESSAGTRTGPPGAAGCRCRACPGTGPPPDDRAAPRPAARRDPVDWGQELQRQAVAGRPRGAGSDRPVAGPPAGHRGGGGGRPALGRPRPGAVLRGRAGAPAAGLPPQPARGGRAQPGRPAGRPISPRGRRRTPPAARPAGCDAAGRRPRGRHARVPRRWRARSTGASAHG
jgi:hypothetical protein